MAVRPEVVQYLQAELQKGFTEQQLRPFMMSKGYSKEVLDEAFVTVRGPPVAAPAQPMVQPAAQPSNGQKRLNTLGLVAFIVIVLPVVLGAVSFVLPIGLLVLGGVSVLCSLAGLIVGVISLRQIKRRGERGKAFPIIAIVFGGLGLLGIILMIVGIVLLGASIMQFGAVFSQADMGLEEVSYTEGDAMATSCEDAQGICLVPSGIDENALTCEDLGLGSLPELDYTCAQGLCCEA